MNSNLEGKRYANRHEAIEDAKLLGAKVVKVGETQHEISTPKGTTYLNDSCQPISKCQSQMILFFYFCMGLFTVAVCGWIAYELLKMIGVA